MKYISIIDELGIDISSISDLTNASVIRLQKQLKAQAVLRQDNNIAELNAILDLIKEEKKAKLYLFVEQNLWLKNLLKGEFFQMRMEDIRQFNYQEFCIEDLKDFLHPFLASKMKTFLTWGIQKSEYRRIFEVLKHNALFTAEINYEIHEFFKSKITYCTSYLSDHNSEKFHAIRFVQHPFFIKCLSIFPDSYIQEVMDFNSVITDVYNDNRKRASHPKFLYAIDVMIALGDLEISQLELKDVLQSNAKIAQRSKSSIAEKNNEGSGRSLPLMIVIFICIIGKFVLQLNRTSSYSPTEKIYTREYIKTDSKKKAHFELIYDIENQSAKHKNMPSKNIDTIKLYNSTNPYPKLFSPFFAVKINEEQREKTITELINKTKKDLIVFRKQNLNSNAIAISENDTISVSLSKGDTLVFYSGKQFSRKNDTRFFSEDSYMTDAFILDSLMPNKKRIIVFPEQNLLSKKGKPYIKDSIHLENISYTTENTGRIFFKKNS